MKKFFTADTVALIGASATPGRPGNSLFQNMEMTFGDKFYPVNPKLDRIEGKQCYPDILQVPAELDLAVIFIPARLIPPALEQCAEKGIQRVIIESSGFTEVGPEGRALHDRCLEIARAAGIRIWGPNCMGLINVPRMKVLSFLIPRAWEGFFFPGPVSLVLQSGMLSAGFLIQALSRNQFGLSQVCSIGNKMDLDESDFLEYFISDPQTGVIAMYLESLGQGRRFLDLARSTDKPIVVLKAGRTGSGARAASSHTGSLAQDDTVLDSAFRQAGVIRVRSMDDLIDVARGFGISGLKPIGPARIAVISFSGGVGVVSADETSEWGLELASFSDSTLARFKTIYPDWVMPINPVDLYPAIEKTGMHESVSTCLKAVMEDPGVDAVLLHAFASSFYQPAFDSDLVAGLFRKYRKPIVTWIMGDPQIEAEITRELEQEGIPVVKELGKGIRILAALTRGK